jgi:hypothetical protein
MHSNKETINAETVVWNGSLDTNWYTNDTTNNEFQINNPKEFAGFASLVNEGITFSEKTVKLNNNILLNNDASNYLNWETIAPTNIWTPIIGFAGIFNGQGHTISGVYTNSTANNSLFGDNSGTIKNLGLIESFITGSGNGGGIVYINNGYVYNCYNSGVVSSIGFYNCGGIVGSNRNIIKNCYNTGKVSGKQNNGGIAGYNWGSIYNCYNIGTVSGSSNVYGSIAGKNINLIENNYWFYNSSTSEGIYKAIGDNSSQSINNESFKGTNLPFSARVNGVEYNTLLDVLNAGVAYYSINENLCEWVAEENEYPKYFTETAKQHNLNISVSNEGQAIISVTEIRDETLQFWVKENISLYGNNNDFIWILKQDYSSNSEIAINNVFEEINDTISVLVRIKDSDNRITQYYKVFSAEQYTSRLVNVISNGQSYSKNETIYLPKTNASIALTFSGAAPQSVITENGNYDTNNILFNDFEVLGLQIIEINIDGFNEFINVKIYDNSIDYAYITSLDIINENDAVFLNPIIETAGNGMDYTIKYTMNGNTNNSGEFNLTDEGYYYYSVKLIFQYNIVDIYTGYYKYGNPEKDINIPLNLSTTINNGVQIGLNEAFLNKEYKIIKWDSMGEYVIKDWSDTSNITFIPNRDGIYKFQYWERTIGSDCSFEQEIFITVNVGLLADNDAEIILPESITARQINEISVNNTNTKTNIMYKYVIRAKGFYSVVEFYSPSNSFVWIPNKKGYYTIEVRIISGTSYGYADTVIISEIINVN